MTTKDATMTDLAVYTDQEYAHDTYQHIELVRNFMGQIGAELDKRAAVHDASKFNEPERSIFREGTHRRDSVPFGGSEYKAHMKTVAVALDHHYANNRHHPEHHAGGVQDMNLLDIVEMLCDWMSASMKDASGDPERVRHVIDINQERFGYSDELSGILHNTVTHLLGGGTREDSS